VDRFGHQTGAIEVLGDAVGAALGAAEDQDAFDRVVAQDLREQGALARLGDAVEGLLDLLDRRQPAE
jgi:hypothetical protein